MGMLITVVMTLTAVVGMRIARDGDESHLVCGDNVS